MTDRKMIKLGDEHRGPGGPGDRGQAPPPMSIGGRYVIGLARFAHDTSIVPRVYFVGSGDPVAERWANPHAIPLALATDGPGARWDLFPFSAVVPIHGLMSWTPSDAEAYALQKAEG